MGAPRRSLPWLLVPVLVACVMLADDPPPDAEGPPPAPPRPMFDHALHLSIGLDCTICHDPEETGEPALPDPALCAECHEKPAEDTEAVREYFASVTAPDGVVTFPPPPYMADLKEAHAAHAAAGVECATCHGEPSDAAFSKPEPLAWMDACIACHQERGAPARCETCHEEARREVAPPSHDADFLRAHGAQAPEGWREGDGASCAICHAVPDDCSSCHERTKPATHRTASFRLFHGRGFVHPFEESSCALCHEEQGCVRCHQTEEPRNHTASFKRRLHGIVASVERESCETCHKPQTCESCHRSTEPLSHRGSWGSGQQSHCIACHEPLTSAGCFTCHKGTPGHLGHAPLPLDGNHIGASDPADCEDCHPVLPHLDDGGRCRRCHR